MTNVRESLSGLPAGKRIIVALDGMGLTAARELAQQIGPRVYAFKVHDLWDLFGSQIVDVLRDVGAERVFVDLKLNDISETVGLRAALVKSAGGNILTVHASGGIEMMREAVESGPEMLLAITALTSLSSAECEDIYGAPSQVVVRRFALMAAKAGVHGIVCSPKELARLNKMNELDKLHFIVPGIRPAGMKVEGDKQQRTGTPRQAILDGASYLVIGRPITQAPDPAAALDAIIAEMEEK